MSRLERWSRKKRGIEQNDPEPASTEPTEGAAPPLEAQALAAKADDDATPAVEQAADAPPPPGSLDHTLPDPDTLPAGSDFSAFMVPGVSATLRRRALRRLWATGNYNVRDGLDDYDADYTQQLKPMASELAGKLRRWANKAEETLDKLDEAAQNDPERASHDEDEKGTGQGSACTSDDSFVQSASLDDQSDYSDHAQGERKKDG
ncbi:DUF3306 domain-containing protein [Halomonas sp. CnH100-B]|uniref:DUF3306 domain-containing protein n=1 Tax=Halomonas sp. CnH100-B TaxID=2954490 RepID=UPI0020973FFD|nr:DUF3306 domain-containing protein [Halomonas sp. CnH100-B]